MSSGVTLIPASLIVGYGLLAAAAGRRHEQSGVGTRRWLVLALLAAALGAAVDLLPADAHARPDYASLFPGHLTQPLLRVILVNLMIVLFGGQALRYLQVRRVFPWTAAGLAWVAAQAGAAVFADPSPAGESGWLGTVYQPVDWPGVLAVGGWLVAAGILLLAAYSAFYRAHLPEVANRALFWAAIVPLVLLGAVLGCSGWDGFAQAGWLIQFIGLGAAVYSVLAYRVFDIRYGMRRAAGTLILVLVTALGLFGALLLARRLEAQGAPLYALLGLLALGGALTYLPLRRLVRMVVQRVLWGSAGAGSQQLHQFSQEITGVVELDALVDVTLRTLAQMLRVRRGGLILVTEETDDCLLIEPFPRGLGEIPEIRGRLTCGGPICRRLIQEGAALLQYDLEYGRVYAGAPLEERRFFQQMRMSAYAPILVQGHLIGILGCGAKTSDDPFSDHDLELLLTLANQTGVALRNARLVGDLRRRETEQAELNRVLSSTKEQLERLDSVKTDFITIASHELRTPLAQIRGYTDIMEAMNEQGLLDQEQIGDMTASLRKAADRLENLIGAMLDVSQLDVNAMDLRFSQTSLESVMRLAIEPLTESIKNRRLMLSARGLRSLPPIQGDAQRLVQAFRNIVLNAIKYTPDGGRIDITGRMQEDHLVVAIKDSGIGIDRANHELIFEKFYRAHDPSLHSTGTTKFMGAGPGLGLTIARGVIEGHGGRIWVESPGYDPERFPGSTFWIELPLNPPASARRVLPFQFGAAKALPAVSGAESGGSGAVSLEHLHPTRTRGSAGNHR